MKRLLRAIAPGLLCLASACSSHTTRFDPAGRPTTAGAGPGRYIGGGWNPPYFPNPERQRAGRTKGALDAD